MPKYQHQKNLKIAIVIYDNDFVPTYECVLLAILAIYKNTEIVNIEKGRLLLVINDIIGGCYLLSRNREKTATAQGLEHIKAHLQVRLQNVFIGDEVDKGTEDKCSDAVILDTCLDYDNNTPIYFSTTF